MNPQHAQMVADLEDLLMINGYEWILEEPFGEGMRVLYRKDNSDIFIEHVNN